ncbi:MAG: succinylglutamate desuccinylase/aspartoacylase family protein [Saprospiraceae bacterium]|nr:succinylglutamate desuccinylase/aspartoacylase family protein [Saprospiraceae bacterium]
MNLKSSYNIFSTEKPVERIIGRYDEGVRGPLVICIGGLHGNEKAGIRAIDLMLKMLEVEHITNVDFEFKGRFLGVTGHLAAVLQNQRYLEKDLNRLWTQEKIADLNHRSRETLDAEDLELYDLESLITREISEYKPERTIILDLHTTSADGGIYTIVPDHPLAIEFALGIKAPVILGFLEGLQGTTLHYFTDENFPGEITGICFEAGQHEDPASVNRAIAAITNCLRFGGCVEERHIEGRHIEVLKEYSEDLPPLTRLAYRYAIHPDEEFKMLPGFTNFQPVHKGQHLADNQNGQVLCPMDGFILMPLYQSKGEDGFFIVQPASLYKENEF